MYDLTWTWKTILGIAQFNASVEDLVISGIGRRIASGTPGYSHTLDHHISALVIIHKYMCMCAI